MQGTGAIAMAGLFSALKVTGIRWRDQRVVVFGGGTAGHRHRRPDPRPDGPRRGWTRAQATAQIWIVDLPGLLTDDMVDGLLDYQRPYARPAAEAADWDKTPVAIDPAAAVRWPEMAALQQARAESGIITLRTVVEKVKPTILIGTSTAHGAFTKEVVEAMSAGVERPVIFPLSNPTSKIEAMPADIIAWSKGEALVATGLPIGPVEYDGRHLPVRAGQQRPGLPGAGPRHDRLRRVQGDRRDAARGGRGGRGPGRRQRSPAPRCCPRSRTCGPPRRLRPIAVAQAATADGVAGKKLDNRCKPCRTPCGSRPTPSGAPASQDASS